MIMLLPVGQVVRFKGRGAVTRADEFEREMSGRTERLSGTDVRITHRTYLKPNLAAEVPQFAIAPGVMGSNGHREAARL